MKTLLMAEKSNLTELQLISNLDVMLWILVMHILQRWYIKVVTLWALHPFAGFSPFNPAATKRSSF
jgi:hypothetical protein